MRFGLVVVLSGVFALAAAKPAAAQAWDAPSFMPSHPVDELGAFALNPPFSDFGVMGLWRQSGDLGLGVRAGIVDLELGGTAFVVGSEFFGRRRRRHWRRCWSSARAPRSRRAFWRGSPWA